MAWTLSVVLNVAPAGLRYSSININYIRKQKTVLWSNKVQCNPSDPVRHWLVCPRRDQACPSIHRWRRQWGGGARGIPTKGLQISRCCRRLAGFIGSKRLRRNETDPSSQLYALCSLAVMLSRADGFLRGESPAMSCPLRSSGMKRVSRQRCSAAVH